MLVENLNFLFTCIKNKRFSVKNINLKIVYIHTLDKNIKSLLKKTFQLKKIKKENFEFKNYSEPCYKRT